MEEPVHEQPVVASEAYRILRSPMPGISKLFVLLKAVFNFSAA